MIEETIAPDAVRLEHYANDNLGPTEFRAHYIKWRKTAPPNDSDIIPDRPKACENPRHAELCSDLQSLLAWKAIREDTGDPLQTNFLQDPNDEEFDEDNDEAKDIERDLFRSLNDGPTAEQMVKLVEGIAFKKTYDLVLCGIEYSWRERLVVNLDAQENREAVISERNKEKRPRVVLGHHYETDGFGKLQPVVKLNHLKLSDSEGNELRPLGSIFSWGLKSEEQKKKKPRVRGSKNFKIAPAPAPRLNPEEHLIEREYRSAMNDNLDPKHIRAMDAAINSPNFESVGIKMGYAAGKTAERWGKRLTLEACKAFDEKKQRFAA